jgi:hypothetical protein
MLFIQHFLFKSPTGILRMVTDLSNTDRTTLWEKLKRLANKGKQINKPDETKVGLIDQPQTSRVRDIL